MSIPMSIRSGFLLTVVASLVSMATAAEFVGQKSQWHDFDRFDFKVDGRECIVVAPDTPAEGRPWVWRARFFGHQPQVDLALLNHGFHLAYCDVAGLFGSPRAVKHWNAFYERMTDTHALSKRPALQGMSRGGLIVYNWAAANPEKVACIYADAPVCDFNSWPAGKGKSAGDQQAWRQCLDAYGLTEAEAAVYSHQPLDNLQPLAQANVPLLHVVGDLDEIVPVQENTAIVETRYKQLGGSIQVIHKADSGHHPHCLVDPSPIVHFVLKHTIPNVQLRGHMDHSRLRFQQDHRGHVAFLGGSITEMDGYRPMVSEDLQQRFPQTEFTFTNAGISSTCSTTGAFRLFDDVLRSDPVDLLFVEFAVNDDQDAKHSHQACVRAMEGIVRQARRHNPNMDIVITFFVNPEMLAQLRKGVTPLTMNAHHQVARHYDVTTIHLAKEVAERIEAGELTWEIFGGVHPKPVGNRIAADMIQRLFDQAWSHPLDRSEEPVAHSTPASPLDPHHYGFGRFIDPAQAILDERWRIAIPPWSELAGGKRARFTDIPMLCADQPGAELKLTFDGTAVGAYVVAGPDAGSLIAQIDDGEPQRVDLYHHHSKGLHYPRTVMFATDLAATTHNLTLRVASESSSDGHAVRIIRFAVAAVTDSANVDSVKVGSRKVRTRQLSLPDPPYNYVDIDWPEHFREPLNRFDNTPDDNPLTNEGATLGRVLFYDEMLSASNTTACASCHKQHLAFTDDARLSVGHTGKEVRRNSMSLVNSRFYQRGRFFWDERARTLEQQVLMPIEDEIEMGESLPNLVQQVAADPIYGPLFKAAFGDAEVNEDRIAKALSQFIRSIVSYRTRYDQGRAMVQSVNDRFPNFTDQENLGKEVFFGRGRCASCHLSNGIPPTAVDGKYPPRQSAFFYMITPVANGIDSDLPDVDQGVGGFNGVDLDIGRFKSPSLRNVAVTGPYMHDGRFRFLSQVIEHYNWSVRPHPNLGGQLQDFAENGLGMPEPQKQALEEFLSTLTDPHLLSDPKFSDPFIVP